MSKFQRLTKGRAARGWVKDPVTGIVIPPQNSGEFIPYVHMSPSGPTLVKTETDEEISARITERFEVLDMLARATITGQARSLIVSGPPGLGKSYLVETLFAKHDPNQLNHTIVKGNIRPTGLYKLLWSHREVGQVLIFDDSDGVFYDEISLALLKTVCDTTEVRNVGWHTEYNFIDDDGQTIPKKFQFDGTIIFISNIDFDAKIDKGDKLAPHLAALISRSHFIDLGMKSRRDYLIRIQQVLDEGMLKNKGLTQNQEDDVLEFIENNFGKLRELSLRTALKVADMCLAGGDWRKMARITTCRN